MKASKLARAAVVLAAVVTTSCGGSRELHLTISPDIPAAQSTAKVSSTNNANTKIDLAVQHLALPARLNPGSTVYVVWVRGDEPGSRPQNIGALKVDGDLKGNITAVMPLRAFELYVTAESSASASTPTGKSLIYTNISMH